MWRRAEDRSGGPADRRQRPCCEVAMWKTISLAIMTIAGAAPAATALAAGSTDVPQLFASTCGFCHENGGRVAGKGPKLAGTARSDAFIVDPIKNGKEGAMPAF